MVFIRAQCSFISSKSNQNNSYNIIVLRTIVMGSMSPFQSQLTILKNTINNWHTLRDNISDQRAETLSQTGVSCSYVLCVIIAKYVPIQRHFYDIKKTADFL